jgi:hypothetical protein
MVPVAKKPINFDLLGQKEGCITIDPMDPLGAGGKVTDSDGFIGKIRS